MPLILLISLYEACKSVKTIVSFFNTKYANLEKMFLEWSTMNANLTSFFSGIITAIRISVRLGLPLLYLTLKWVSSINAMTPFPPILSNVSGANNQQSDNHLFLNSERADILFPMYS